MKCFVTLPIVLIVLGNSCSKIPIYTPRLSTKVRFSDYVSKEGNGGQIQFQDECYGVTIDRLELNASSSRPSVRVSYVIKLADGKFKTVVINENGDVEHQ